MGKRRHLAAEDLARRILAAARSRCGVPLDLDELTCGLGLSLREEQIEPDGCLFLAEKPPLVLVKQGQPVPRQRFTIAHELAHWAVATNVDRAAVRRIKAAFVSEEVMCNTVAGALLMPATWLRCEFASATDPDHQTIRTIRAVASRADVSLAAATIRLRDVFGWEKTLLHWTQHDRRWIFDGEAGVDAEQLGLVRPTRAATEVLDWLDFGYASTILPLRIAGFEDDVQAELFRGRGHVSALIPTP